MCAAPVDIATAHTLAFVRDLLPVDAARVLEIGCGNGALAAELLAAGCRLTALDASEEAVAICRARGVDAHCVQWPAYDPPAPEQRYDVVLFSRSLHHMADPQAAVARARQCLGADAPHGALLIVEDFAVECLDARTADWFATALRLLDAAGQLAMQRSPLIERLLTSPRPLDVWRAEHGHHAHASVRLEQALAAAFAGHSAVPTEYLFRYVHEALGPGGEAITREILAMERALGELRPASLIGRRYVARP